MDDLIIKGAQKTSLLDYPGRICTTIFLSKCNFRCPYCYNPELVLDKSEKSDIKEDEIIEFLEQKKKWVESVCITGGEPTLHSGLKRFIKRIKEIGLLVKLDTNGTNPEIVEELIKEGLVNYIAMDIKAGKENYEKVTKSNLFNKVQQTIKILKKYGSKESEYDVDYEFRTTVHPDLFNRKELRSIIEIIKGSKRYVLQQFKPDVANLEKINKKMYSEKILRKFMEIAKPYFNECLLRGI